MKPRQWWTPIPSVYSESRPRSLFQTGRLASTERWILTNAQVSPNWLCLLPFQGGCVPSKSKKESVDKFVEYFKESLSCVTGDWLTAFQESGNLFKLTFNPPAALDKAGGGNLYLICTQVLTAVSDPTNEGRFKARTREYSYRLVEEQDVGAPDLVAYHWHPNDSELRPPHLHVPAYQRIHFPTSRVCVEDFILMLIKYYDVRPVFEAIRVDSYFGQKQGSF
jgi:hypothetical protein